MTILYKVVQNVENIKDINAVTTNYGVLCKISAKSIVAFCTLQDGTHSNVFVCDIVSPWQTFKLCSSKSIVTVLDWSYNGELLLVGYKNGNIEIWSTRQQTLNAWWVLYKANFPNEEILMSRFFHNGKSVYFHSQKKELPYYAEKFERLEHRPTLSQFGGAASEGCLIITSSGLLGAFIIPKFYNFGTDSAPNMLQTIDLSAHVVTHSIGLSRSFIVSSSMSHCPSGSINIAVNCSSREQIIHCFKVSLKLDNNKENLLMLCESLPSVFIDGATDRKRISQLKWKSINNEDIIFLAYDTIDGGSKLEQWNLTKKHQVVHKLLQKKQGDSIICESWENTAKLHMSAGISEVCLSKLLSDNFQIFAVLKDNTVQVLEMGLKKVGVTIFDRFANERHIGCKFVTADISLMNQILLIIDNYGQMYAMQVANPHLDKNFKLNTIFQHVSLLEYSIITGIDASDVLVSVLMFNLGNLDMLIEKLRENFTRQPPFTRHFYYSNFLSLKSNMCRIQSKQQDFDNLIILHSISITFKSLLRPSDLSCPDKSPADNLAIILSEPLSDVDKVLFNLDAKDFTVEPVTLQSLQQLIQWVADLALGILNKLPDEVMKSKLSKKQGYDISRDIVAIGSIRELLVMIRIWGLLNSQCLPIYTKSVENIDVLSILFRLLTRLAQNTNEPDELLLDECSLLSTQILIPPRQFNNPTTLLNNHMAMIKSFPLIFTTAVEPIKLQDIKVEEVVFANGIKDGVSNLQLGSKISQLRKCIRCGFVNNLQKVSKTSALKAWCHRWLYCHCGGYWRTIKN